MKRGNRTPKGGTKVTAETGARSLSARSARKEWQRLELTVERMRSMQPFRECTWGARVRQSVMGTLLERLSGKDPRVSEEGEEPGSLTRPLFPCLPPKKRRVAT